MLHTYEVITDDKKLRVKIPDNWKITYGQVQTGVKQWRPGGRGPGGTEAFCLRIYEAENKQRMIINNVVSFRDMSIPVEEMTTAVIDMNAEAWDAANMVEAWEPLDFVDLEDVELELEERV